MSDKVSVDLSFKPGWLGWLVMAAFMFCTCTYTCGNLTAGPYQVGCGQQEQAP